MSHADMSSTKGDFDKCGRYIPETLPQPITPTLIFFCCRPRAFACMANGPSIDAAVKDEACKMNSFLVVFILRNFWTIVAIRRKCGHDWKLKFSELSSIVGPEVYGFIHPVA